MSSYLSKKCFRMINYYNMMTQQMLGMNDEIINKD